MYNAMLIDPKDNVVVAVEEIQAGEQVSYSGETDSFPARESIIIFHKVARCDIPKGSPIIKYGEHIGVAGCDIFTGNHIHVHNVESHREQLV